MKFKEETEMAKEAYIEIDGKRTQLTVEQMKALGIYEEPKKNPFDRVKKDKQYYYITNGGDVDCGTDYYWESDNKRHKVANYCTDKELMQQRALHETLNRLLWRFSMENCGEKINWNNGYLSKYVIVYDHRNEKFEIRQYDFTHFGTIYFHTKEIAQRAIEEIILPFMKEHSDFFW